jgi:hypothetical protein
MYGSGLKSCGGTKLTRYEIVALLGNTHEKARREAG